MIFCRECKRFEVTTSNLEGRGRCGRKQIEVGADDLRFDICEEIPDDYGERIEKLKKTLDKA